MNTKFSNVLSVRQHLSGLNIRPATLKSRSIGADAAGMTRYCAAKCANVAKQQ